MKIEKVETVRCRLGENAFWSTDDNCLFFIDIFGCSLFRHDPSDGSTRSWDTGGNVGAMALREDGGALIAMANSLYTLDFDSGAVTKIAGPLFPNKGATINDGAVDPQGRFLFGGCSAGMENPRPVGGLYRLDADHGVTQLDDGIYQSNSHCFSPDGGTLYCSDSFTYTTSAYDYDIESGAVSGKRVLINTKELGGRPDGSAVDAVGTVWISLFEAGKIAAVKPDGKLDRTIDMPVRLVSSVAFGGPDLDLLYVTTIDPTEFGWPTEEGAGNVYVVEGLGTHGVPEHRYRG